MRRSRRGVALLAGSLAGIVVLAFAIVVGSRAAFSPHIDYAGTPVQPPRAAADFTLTDGVGAPAHLLDPAVDLTLLFFGYTHCPDECPIAMASLGRAYRSLPSAVAARTRVVFVTVDPERDTPAVVERYVRAFDPHFVGLTGTQQTLSPVWRAYGVAVDPVSKEIAHGGAIYAVDRSQHVVLVYPSDEPSTGLAADARKLAD